MADAKPAGQKPKAPVTTKPQTDPAASKVDHSQFETKLPNGTVLVNYVPKG